MKQFRDYSAAERRQMAKTGEARSDGSYPIATQADLDNAVMLYRMHKGAGHVSG